MRYPRAECGRRWLKSSTQVAIFVPRVIEAQANMAFDVNLVPLSETIIPGLPRRSINVVSSRATRRPEIEVSRIAARHSLVTSSTMFRMRKRLPQESWS